MRFGRLTILGFAPNGDRSRALRAALVGMLVLSGACAARGRDPDLLTQVATLPELAAGRYDGVITCGELRRAGDFGLGTFDRLDGEMIVLDGRVYRVSSDGVARPAPDSVTTPFAAVTFFRGDGAGTPGAGMSLAELGMAIDRLLPDTSKFYAVRITGRFRRLRTRSVPRQRSPYPRLSEVVRTQPTFDFTETDGTLVGLRTPAVANGLNQAGYHFHFLTADHRAGGHVLVLETGAVTVMFDRTARWKIFLRD